MPPEVAYAFMRSSGRCAFSSSSPAISTYGYQALFMPISAAALTAAALMGMNNAWYPYVEMAGDDELKAQRPELRMNAYATSGGIAKKKFEALALAASIVGKCHFCVSSHYALLKKEGLTTQQLRDIGRIAAVVNAAAQSIAAG